MEKRIDLENIMLLYQLMNLTKYQTNKNLEQFGLKPGQVGILFLLLRHDGMTGRELAKNMGITPPSMTVALQKLEKTGYVRKEFDENDQRMMHVFLTEDGKRCIEHIKNSANKTESLLYKGISEEEQKIMKELLLKMRNNLMEGKEFQDMNIWSIMKKTAETEKENCF